MTPTDPARALRLPHFSAGSVAIPRRQGDTERDRLFVGSNIGFWNDALGQTAENVAAKMERAADKWELEQTPPVEWTHRESRVSQKATS